MHSEVSEFTLGGRKTGAISWDSVLTQVSEPDKRGRAQMGGRQKRKNNSPLQKDDGKSRRTVEDDCDDVEGEDCGSQEEQDDVIADLKEFIRNENAISSKKTGARNSAVQ